MSAFMLQQPLLLCRFDLFYIQLWSILLSTLHILSSAIYKRRTMRSARPQCTRLTKFFIFSLSALVFCIISLSIEFCILSLSVKFCIFSLRIKFYIFSLSIEFCIFILSIKFCTFSLSIHFAYSHSA